MLQRLPTWLCLAAAALALGAAALRAFRVPSAREAAARFAASRARETQSGTRVWRDATAELGVEFVHDADFHGAFRLPEEMGPGVALFDADGDGDLDLFVAGGGSLDGTGPVQTCRLWLNEGGRMRDATSERGCDLPGPAYGVACADYDDDGDSDVFVTRLGPNALLRNDGARFTEVAAAAGVADPGFGTGAVFFDYDRDGRLDLYAATYVDWTPSIEQACYAHGVRDYCDPTNYRAPGQDRLYRNVGDGRFEDVTERAGMLGARGQGLGVVAEDFDGDGWTDVYVANDSTPAMLWHNRGDGSFEDIALRAGCALNALGIAIAGMGVACEDLDGDLRFDLLVTNIRDQSHLALLSRGARFEDAGARLGLPAWSVPWTGFGVAVFDADHDGGLEGYIANGAVNLAPARVGSERPYVEPDQFVRFESGRTRDVSAGSGVSTEESSRGLACGDIDGDGDLDLAISANGGRLIVLLNESAGGRAWLIVDARTKRGAPALGARVEVLSGGRRQVRAIRAHSSYLSSMDPRAHFGLGESGQADEVLLRWPDGSETRLGAVAAGQVLRVEQEGR